MTLDNKAAIAAIWIPQRYRSNPRPSGADVGLIIASGLAPSESAERVRKVRADMYPDVCPECGCRAFKSFNLIHCTNSNCRHG